MAAARSIVVLVKYVPDAGSDRGFAGGDHLTVRSGEGLLSELDEYAVEAALGLAESGDWSVTAVTMGPEAAGAAVKKALQMGADAGVHVCDDGLVGDGGDDGPAGGGRGGEEGVADGRGRRGACL